MPKPPKPAARSQGARPPSKAAPTTPAAPPPWGEPYGGDALVHADGRKAFLRRKGQRARWYGSDGLALSPEQSNVAPALAWAEAHGFRQPPPKAPGRTPAAWLNKGPGRTYPCKSKYIDKTLPMRGRKGTVEACATPSREKPREGRFRVGYDSGGHANVPKSAVHRAAYRQKHPKPAADPGCPPWKKGCGGAKAAGAVDPLRAEERAWAAETATFPALVAAGVHGDALRARLAPIARELNAANGALPRDRYEALHVALFALRADALDAPPVDRRRAALRSLATVVAEHPAFEGDGRRARAFRADMGPIRAELDAADGPLTEARHRALHTALDALSGRLPQVEPAAAKAAPPKERTATMSADDPYVRTVAEDAGYASRLADGWLPVLGVPWILVSPDDRQHYTAPQGKLGVSGVRDVLYRWRAAREAMELRRPVMPLLGRFDQATRPWDAAALRAVAGDVGHAAARKAVEALAAVVERVSGPSVAAAPAAGRKVDVERAALRGRAADLALHPGLNGDGDRATSIRARLTGARAELAISDGPLGKGVHARLDAALRGILSDAARNEAARATADDPGARRRGQPRWGEDVDPVRERLRVTASGLESSPALRGDTVRAVDLRERFFAVADALNESAGPIPAAQRKAIEAKLATLTRAAKEHDDAAAAAAKASAAKGPPARREYSRTAYKFLGRLTERLGLRMPPIGATPEGFARYASHLIVQALERECYGTMANKPGATGYLCRFEREVKVAQGGASASVRGVDRGGRASWYDFRADGSVWIVDPERGVKTPKTVRNGTYTPERSQRLKGGPVDALDEIASYLWSSTDRGPVLGIPAAEQRRHAPGALEAAFSVDAVSSATLRKMLAGGRSVKGRRVTLVGNAQGQSVRVLVDREGAQLDVTVPAKVAKPGEVILDAPVFAAALKTGFSVRPADGAFGVFNGSARLGDAHLRGNGHAPAAGSTVGRDLARLGPQALDAMARVLPMASTDDTRPHLASVLLDGPLGIAVTTDGHRLCKSPLGQTFPGVLLVPRDAVEWLLALAQNFKAPAVELKHVAGRLDLLFVVGTARLHAEMTKAPYPSYQQVIPSGVDGSVVVRRRELLASLEGAARSKKFPSRTYGVRLHFPKRKMSAENPNTDNDTMTYWEAPVPVVSTSGKVVDTIGFNVAYIIDALKSAVGDTVTFGLSGELDPCTITDAAGTVSVCMPMRV